MHRFVRRAFLTLALLPAAWAPAQNRGLARPQGQQVQLPYVMRDNFNVQWDVQMDGSIGDGGNDLYDGGGRLTIAGQQYNSPQPQAMFDPKSNEVTLGNQSIGGLTVHRRIAVNAEQGWCRFTEVLENGGAAPVRASVLVNFDMGGGVQQQQPVNSGKKAQVIGCAIFDGQRGIGMLGGGEGGKVPCNYNPQLNTDQVNLNYEVEVPARQAVCLVHFQAMRPTLNDAATWVGSAKEKDLLGDMPKEIRRSIVNFRRAGESAIADIDLPRQPLMDVIQLRSGDQLRGTLKDASFKLQTFHGVVQVPADTVIGMITVGAYRPMQLLVTVEGEVIGGALLSDGLSIQLAAGQTMVVPLASISKVGCRKRPTEQEELKIDKPMAYLRDGQRIAVELPDESFVTATTLFGPVQLKPEWIQSIHFSGDEQTAHVVKLKDGSRFAAVVSGPDIELKLRGAGSAAAPATRESSSASESAGGVKFPLASIARLQFAPPDTDAKDAEPPTLTLKNGDALVGVIGGALELETAFDVIKLNGSEIRTLKHVEAPENGGFASPVEVTATLWDGLTISGRVKGDSLQLQLQSGKPVAIAIALVDNYSQPNPAPSSTMVDQIKLVLKDLTAPDWKKRDRAAGQLRSIGPAAIAVLKELRQSEPAAAQQLIDGIIKDLEKEAAPATPPATPGNGGNRIRRFK